MVSYFTLAFLVVSIGLALLIVSPYLYLLVHPFLYFLYDEDEFESSKRPSTSP